MSAEHDVLARAAWLRDSSNGDEPGGVAPGTSLGHEYRNGGQSHFALGVFPTAYVADLELVVTAVK